MKHDKLMLDKTKDLENDLFVTKYITLPRMFHQCPIYIPPSPWERLGVVQGVAD